MNLTKYSIKNFDEVTSTLDIAADKGYTHGDVIVAELQTAGRGQRGNKWSSTRGQNLTFTIVIEPTHIRASEQFAVSMCASLAVAGALKKCGVAATVKWPNDIYVGDKKICGILIEHFLSGEFLDKSIIGIGVNVEQVEFDSALPNPTSLHILGVKDCSNEQLLNLILSEFSALYDLSALELLEKYMDCLYRRNGIFNYADDTEKFSASIDSIDPHSGRITLRDTTGKLRPYFFKEVTYQNFEC